MGAKLARNAAKDLGPMEYAQEGLFPMLVCTALQEDSPQEYVRVVVDPIHNLTIPADAGICTNYD